MPARNPDHNQMNILIIHRLHDWIVQRLDAMAQADQFLEDFVNPLLFNSLQRKNRRAVFLLHADDDIAAAHVVNIIGKRAYAVDDRRRIPVRLKLHARGLHYAAIDQIVQIHRNGHGLAPFSVLSL